MIDKLLTSKDWQYAGIKFKDAQPMLVEAAVCQVADSDVNIIITVAEGPHPYKESTPQNPVACSAEHYIAKSDITGITFYNEVEVNVPKIMAPNGKQKGEKLIIT